MALVTCPCAFGLSRLICLQNFLVMFRSFLGPLRCAAGSLDPAQLAKIERKAKLEEVHVDVYINVDVYP